MCQKRTVTMNGKIYVIRNTNNNKVYVGQTTQSVEDRFAQHKRLCNSNKKQLIYKALLKYGADCFYVEEIESGIPTYEELNSKESHYIQLFNSMEPNGYNLNPGGNFWRRRPSLSNAEEREVIKLYVKGEMSQRQIASKYGVSHHTIGSVLKRHGIKSREKTCHLPDRTSVITKDDLSRMYIAEKMKMKDIAMRYGVDVRTVNRAKNRFNLKRI